MLLLSIFTSLLQTLRGSTHFGNSFMLCGRLKSLVSIGSLNLFVNKKSQTLRLGVHERVYPLNRGGSSAAFYRTQDFQWNCVH